MANEKRYVFAVKRLSNLIELYKSHEGPFKKGLGEYYYSMYLEYTKKTGIF
jgi:hypothetical protein